MKPAYEKATDGDIIKVIIKLLALYRNFKLAKLSSAEEPATQMDKRLGGAHSLPGHSGEEGKNSFLKSNLSYVVQ